MTKLYLGLNPQDDEGVVHYPVIRIAPRLEVLPEIRQLLQSSSHLIVTSKTTVNILCENLPIELFQGKKIITVGKVTSQHLENYGLQVDATAQNETAEGVIEVLKGEDIRFALWPHSALARTVITDFLEANNIPFAAPVLYDTVPNNPGPLPKDYSKIIFTSPSTVHNFFSLHPSGADGKALHCIGPITSSTLDQLGKTGGCCT